MVSDLDDTNVLQMNEDVRAKIVALALSLLGELLMY
jgi:hypothetical protein